MGYLWDKWILMGFEYPTIYETLDFNGRDWQRFSSVRNMKKHIKTITGTDGDISNNILNI
jgi:hypothetical protein